MSEYLGGGKIETVVIAPGKRCLKETRYYGNHTEVTKKVWVPKEYV